MLKRYRFLRMLAAVTVVVLLVAACSGDGGSADDGADAGDPSPADDAAAQDDAADDGAAEDDTAEDDTAEDGDDVAADGFDWRQHEGESIRVLFNQHPWQEAIEPLIPEFEELTGIDVEVEQLPEAQFRQRAQVELTSGSSGLDVFMTSLLNEGANYAQNGWYTDLRQFVDDPSLTSPDYAFDDFGDGLIDSHTIDGELVGIPIQLETQMLYYRKDILEAAGVEVPTTMEELESVAQTIDDPDGVRAFVARGKGASSVTQISTYLYNFGGQWTEEGSFEAAFNSPEGIEAFDFYTRMLREYGPRGTTNMSWEEALPLFQQGQVAMYTDASTFMSNIVSESTPEVQENVGYAPMPAGPGGDFQTFFGWAIGMSAFTEVPEASWLFIQWATSPEVVERLTVEGNVAGGRSSVDFGDDFPAEWVEAFTQSLPTARPQLPQVIPVSEVREVIGNAVIAGIEEGDLEAAMADAAEQFNTIVGAGD